MADAMVNSMANAMAKSMAMAEAMAKAMAKQIAKARQVFISESPKQVEFFYHGYNDVLDRTFLQEKLNVVPKQMQSQSTDQGNG